jgi:hypothetical protein
MIVTGVVTIPSYEKRQIFNSCVPEAIPGS